MIEDLENDPSLLSQYQYSGETIIDLTENQTAAMLKCSPSSESTEAGPVAALRQKRQAATVSRTGSRICEPATNSSVVKLARNSEGNIIQLVTVRYLRFAVTDIHGHQTI